eukprot:288625-Pyramimonas_sp.AAC.1
MADEAQEEVLCATAPLSRALPRRRAKVACLPQRPWRRNARARGRARVLWGGSASLGHADVSEEQA